MRVALKPAFGTVTLSLLLAGACRPEDPRNDPAGIIEVSRELGQRIDRDRALGGFRTREEFIRHVLEQYVASLEMTQQLDPDMFIGHVVPLLQRIETPQREDPR